MNDTMLRHALACAGRGWPVFPCQPGQKIPATRHGHLDATTSERQITAWFGWDNDWNLAVATGAPGPDVLDIGRRPGRRGNGFGAFARLLAAGLLEDTVACVRTPSGGMHAYFTGTRQRMATCPRTISASGRRAAMSSSRRRWPAGARMNPSIRRVARAGSTGEQSPASWN